MNALDESPNADSTVVVLTSDHGWHVGEKGRFGKETLWEDSTHVPFIIVAPGVTKPGTRIDRAVDLVHLAPTGSDLAGVPVDQRLDGKSLRPLLEDPGAPWNTPPSPPGRGRRTRCARIAGVTSGIRMEAKSSTITATIRTSG